MENQFNFKHFFIPRSSQEREMTVTTSSVDGGVSETRLVLCGVVWKGLSRFTCIACIVYDHPNQERIQVND